MNRLLCSQVIAVSGHGVDERQTGVLEEISRFGAAVSVEMPIACGAEITLDCATCELRGKVTRCREYAGGYSAEVEFTSDREWPVLEFRPEQLFNPQSLICPRPGCRSDCTGDGCMPEATVR